MKATSLLHIAMDSIQFTFKNTKECLVLLALPFTALLCLELFANAFFYSESTEMFTAQDAIITLITTLITLPFTIQWTKFVLGKKSGFSYNDSAYWNNQVSEYLKRYVLVILIAIALSLPVGLILGLSKTLPSNISFYAIVLSILIAIWLFTFIIRISFILTAYIDEKNLGVKSAIAQTKNTSTAILLSMLLFLIIMMIISIPFIILMVTFSNMIESNNIFILPILSTAILVGYSVLISALQITFTTMLYQNLLGKK